MESGRGMYSREWKVEGECIVENRKWKGNVVEWNGKLKGNV